MKGAAAILPPVSPFYLYGPYIREGFATAPSNQAFDRSLRDRNPTSTPDHPNPNAQSPSRQSGFKRHLPGRLPDYADDSASISSDVVQACSRSLTGSMLLSGPILPQASHARKHTT